MNKIISKITWWVFGALCVLTGVYPIIYFLVDRHFGLLSSKSQDILNASLWNVGFYAHITLGGIALLIGWLQFSRALRSRNIRLHRMIGKVYVVCAIISGVCGIYIAQFATGGTINVVAFSMSGLIWVITSVLAYKAAKKGNIDRHANLMIYSYAVCFSAVTLRIWLPLLTIATGEFITAYLIVGWLSWVPNVLVAYYIINRKKKLPPVAID